MHDLNYFLGVVSAHCGALFYSTITYGMVSMIAVVVLISCYLKKRASSKKYKDALDRALERLEASGGNNFVDRNDFCGV